MSTYSRAFILFISTVGGPEAAYSKTKVDKHFSALFFCDMKSVIFVAKVLYGLSGL